MIGKRFRPCEHGGMSPVSDSAPSSSEPTSLEEALSVLDATDLDADSRRGYHPEFNAPFSMAWIARGHDGERTDRQLDALLVAWDGLMRQPEWREWHSTYKEPVSLNEFMMLQVDDRAKRRFSRGRDGGLSMFIPVTEIEQVENDPSALNEYMTSVLVDFHVRLAETHGLPGVPETDRT
jgi:hypothetical protein